MVKLFALEEDKTSSGNDLIIDKLLEKTKEEKSPLSLTADLLKQREDINKELKDQLEESEQEEDDSSSDDDSADNDNDENDPEESSEEPNEDDDSEESDSNKDKNENQDEVDEDTAAEDKDTLSSLVGSGLKSGDKPKDDKPKEKEEVAEESFNKRVTLRNIFQPLHAHAASYKLSLETYNLEESALPTDKQPIVYVKEAVLESIANLTKISFSYIENTNSFVERVSESTLALNEKITVFSNLVEAKKYHFTNKLVKDKDILENVSYKGHSDIRETSRVLAKYIEQSNIAVSLMMSNPFDEIRSAFTAKDFIDDETDVVYAKQLPGFNMVKVALEPYSNYLKTKLENFQYFKLKTVKTEDVYALSAISVSEDKDLEYIVGTVNDLIASTTVSIDTLKGVSGHFTTFTDELKVLAYNVENNQYTNLTDLGIDEKVKDFIRFKLAMEASFININLILDYITSVTSVLNVCLELSE